jgi:hypothetical protein
MKCADESCHKDALVGVGEPAVWVCMDHFNTWLDEKSRVIATAIRNAQWEKRKGRRRNT